MGTKKEKFVWGVATASAQVEGAAQEDGRGPSIWDAFADIPGRTARGAKPDVTCDQYHRYAEDIALMRRLGVGAYRFSISWSRVQPDGKGDWNEAGFAYYDRLIDALLEAGIQPWVTLYHWDLPLALQMEDDGWMNPSIVDRYTRYAAECFRRFSGRVKNYMTFNEAWCVAVLGHGNGAFAPGRRSDTEPYVVGHHILLAHGQAVRAFRDGGYAGQIGITNNCDWREPATDSPADQAAARRAVDFFYGWFGDPVAFGTYPDSMREILGKRLPAFTPDEAKLLAGSYDFIGLNHYTTLLAADGVAGDADPEVKGNGGIMDDQRVRLSVGPGWTKMANEWHDVPWGFRKLLNWLHQRYPGKPVYVTENGAVGGDDPREVAVKDDFRVKFLKGYTDALFAARDQDGVDVRGYFCWSLLDVYEWSSGFDYNLGLVHIDHTNQDRTPKASFDAYRQIIQANP